MIVLDASAALAYLLSERGGALVQQNLAQSVISSVNLIEVARRLRRNRTDQQVGTILAAFRGKLHSVEDVTINDVPLATQVYADFQKPHNISLGDAVCLAVGMRLNAEVWTAELGWAALPNVGRVKIIR